MKSLTAETFYPSDQYELVGKGKDKKLKDGAKGYKIKALSSLQLTEAMTEGFKKENGLLKMTFEGIKILLRHGLEDPSEIENMRSAHHVEVAKEIFTKASLAEDERKN